MGFLKSSAFPCLPGNGNLTNVSNLCPLRDPITAPLITRRKPPMPLEMPKPRSSASALRDPGAWRALGRALGWPAAAVGPIPAPSRLPCPRVAVVRGRGRACERGTAEAAWEAGVRVFLLPGTAGEGRRQLWVGWAGSGPSPGWFLRQLPALRASRPWPRRRLRSGPRCLRVIHRPQPLMDSIQILLPRSPLLNAVIRVAAEGRILSAAGAPDILYSPIIFFPGSQFFPSLISPFPFRLRPWSGHVVAPSLSPAVPSPRGWCRGTGGLDVATASAAGTGRWHSDMVALLLLGCIYCRESPRRRGCGSQVIKLSLVRIWTLILMVKFLLKYRWRERGIDSHRLFIFSFLPLLSRGRVDAWVSVRWGCPVLARGSAGELSHDPRRTSWGKLLGKRDWSVWWKLFPTLPSWASSAVGAGSALCLGTVPSLRGSHVCFCVPCGAPRCDQVMTQGTALPSVCPSRHRSPSRRSPGGSGMGVPGVPWARRSAPVIKPPGSCTAPEAVKKMLMAVFHSLLLWIHTGLGFICFLTNIFLYNGEIFILSNKRQ